MICGRARWSRSIERLIGKGYDLRLYDRNVNLASLTGRQQGLYPQRIPHISKLMVDRHRRVLIGHGEVIVIGNGGSEFKDILERDSRRTGYCRPGADQSNSEAWRERYDGICW